MSACTTHTDCHSNYCRDGTCATPGYGQFCSPSHQNCLHPYQCDSESKVCVLPGYQRPINCTGTFIGECSFQDYCGSRRRCEKRLRLGEQCIEYQCEHGLVCIHGRCEKIPRSGRLSRGHNKCKAAFGLLGILLVLAAFLLALWKVKRGRNKPAPPVSEKKLPADKSIADGKGAMPPPYPTASSSPGAGPWASGKAQEYLKN